MTEALERVQRVARAKSGKELADSWNGQYPVGTPVNYFPPNGRDPGDRRSGRTRSIAVVRDGAAYVLIEGCDGFVALGDVVAFQLGPEDAADLEEFSRAVGEASTVNVVLELDALGAVMLIGALQMVCRHPMLGEHVGEMLRDIAREMQGQLPEPLQTMANRGWNRFYDAQAVEVPWDGRVDTSQWAPELAD